MVEPQGNLSPNKNEGRKSCFSLISFLSTI